MLYNYIPDTLEDALYLLEESMLHFRLQYHIMIPIRNHTSNTNLVILTK